jgi:hypothetical protein
MGTDMGLKHGRVFRSAKSWILTQQKVESLIFQQGPLRAAFKDIEQFLNAFDDTRLAT